MSRDHHRPYVHVYACRLTEPAHITHIRRCFLMHTQLRPLRLCGCCSKFTVRSDQASVSMLKVKGHGSVAQVCRAASEQSTRLLEQTRPNSSHSSEHDDEWTMSSSVYQHMCPTAEAQTSQQDWDLSTGADLQQKEERMELLCRAQRAVHEPMLQSSTS